MQEEQDFWSFWQKEHLTFYKSEPSSFFVGKGNKNIHYKLFEQENDRPIIMFLAGQSEPVKKYSEFYHGLYNQGFSVAIMDHRGHGNSDRLIMPRDITHVNSFSDYSDDVITFFNEVVLPIKRNRKVFLIAHSMGSMISALALSQLEIGSIEKVVFNAPMFKINTGKYSNFVARRLANFLVLVGKGNQFSVGQKGYDPNRKFEGNRVTSSRKRFFVRNQIGMSEGGLALGGVSNRWLAKALNVTKKKNIKKIAKKIKASILILSAENEEVVDNERMKFFCEVSSNCVIKLIPQARHEILIESDEIRSQALLEIDKHLND